MKYWLGGLDSNQDSQIQSLESYQLDDLPAGRNKKESRHVRLSRQPRFTLPNLIGFHQCVNQPPVKLHSNAFLSPQPCLYFFL
jgi:hypothetical protein